MTSSSTISGCKREQVWRFPNSENYNSTSGPECFNFLPESYALPSERPQLVEAMKAEEESLWIVKPSYQACGQGIFIIKRSRELLTG